MADGQLDDSVFQPLSKVELQLQVDELVTKLRTLHGEEYIAAVANLWTTEEIVDRYINMGQDRRTAEYKGMLDSNPNSESFQEFQLRYLVFYSLTDEELNNIKDTIKEVKAREQGFNNYDEKAELTEEILIRYLELCKHHYFSTFFTISWENLISKGNRYSVLRSHAYVEPGGDFAPETVEYFRSDLMQCSMDVLKNYVVKGLEEAEQKMIEVMYVNPNQKES